MKPDAYMPFYGNDIFIAVKSYDEITQLAYIKLIWFYWHHNHCKGLENNSDFLRRTAEVDRENWPEVEGRLFDNDKFFVQCEHFLWHQKRADELWAEVTAAYQKAVENGKKGGYHAHKARKA